MKFPTRSLLAACAATIALAAHGPAVAQGYPNKPLKLIVAYSAGGPADAGARVIATGLSKSLGQPVVVDNRPGAAGRIGTEAAARSAPDGYTFILGTADSFTLNPHVFTKQSFNPQTAFDPIAPFARIPLVLTMRSQFPESTTAGLVKYAKANPNKVSYGTWGVGGLAHIGGIMLEQIGHMEMLHVPFPGGAPAQQQLLGNQIDLAFTGVQFAEQQVKVGGLKIVGLTSPQRTPLAPSIPTLAEAGFPGYAVEQWCGLFVPAGTPADVRAKLTQAIREYMATPAAQAAVKEVGLEPLTGGPQELAAILKADYERWGKLVRERNISAE